MASRTTKVLSVGAALFGGLLAGVTANRALVQLPAWGRIGIVPFSDFTQAENHGVGLFFYPAVGLIALLLTAATAIAFRFDRGQHHSRSLPVYLAVLMAMAGAVVTRTAIVPAMFQFREAGITPAELQQVFISVSRWWEINDVLHVLAFAFNLWALTEILQGTARRSSN